jgi:aminopeptidase N
VYCETPDVEAVEVNFDGITYAKGASVLKQLVAYVGIDAFLAGLRAYFERHAWGNATFDDLLSALEAASGRELRKWAAEWLETTQVNTLRPDFEIGPDGTYTRVAVRQEAPEKYPTLRTHRIGVGLYDIGPDGALARRQFLEADVTGARTELRALTGVRAADVLLLNDEDLTYAKLRLDERSMANVVEHFTRLDNPLARALCWSASWDMVRDGELAARDYLRLVVNGLPSEHDINLVTATLMQVRGALSYYAEPAWAPEGWQRLARTAEVALTEAEAGGDFQLAWARAYVAASRDGADLAVLADWLRGQDVPPGLTVAGDLRWSILQSLVSGGAAGPDEIEAELDADRTASGERQAAVARALIPTAGSKAETWRRIVEDRHLPNWLLRSLLHGFQHASQVALTAPYVEPYFAAVDEFWATRDIDPAQDFVEIAFPAYQVSDETVARAEAWLADGEHPPPLRRLVAEGRDGLVRSLRARAKDASAA